jgi:hypothetical protein
MSDAAKASVESAIASLANDLRKLPPEVAWNRILAFDAINSERAYQNHRWPQDGRPNPLSIGEFVLLADEYIAKARAEWSQEKAPEKKALAIVRKAAGILTNCMEQHGAPLRLPPHA